MFKILFSPITIGRLELKNRIVMPAMATNLTEFGQISQRLVDFYQARARGGAAAIFVLSVPIFMKSELASFRELWGIDMPTVHSDDYLPELEKLIQPLKSAGARVGIQLVHMGNQGIKGMTGTGVVAPSAVPSLISKDKPTPLTREEIRHLVDQFTDAALRCRAVGYDMVELHGAHGYLISNFLSPYFNNRQDEYGGSLENRARFPSEIISGIKSKTGDSLVVGIRINGSDNIPGGTTVQDAAAIATYLERSGADYISVSGGVYGSAKATVPPMMEEKCCYVSLASEIKQSLSVPVIVAGRINTPDMAEEILQRGDADMIGMARPLVADPDFPLKAAAGHANDIRKCVACNQGCIDQINKTILPGKGDDQDNSLTCLVNPEAGKEKALHPHPTSDRKKILVVGGGPAGMRFAVVAAQCGHEVTLMEKSNSLGGQLKLAASIPYRQDMAEVTAYLAYEMKRLNVRVITGKKVNRETIEAYQPDKVVIATGANPILPALKNPDIKTATAWEVLRGDDFPEKNILIVGGGSVGLETALFIAKTGRRITIIEQTNHFGADMGPISRFYLRSKLNRFDISYKKSARFIKIENKVVILQEDDSRTLLENIELIIFSIGAAPDNALAKELSETDYQPLVIGDALKPGNALQAIGAAHRAATEI
ncbi:NAD(P)/FAD-dependent oxidoreductase [bacterium]|nr:NAD(P)/FAD-dependent oxidoreductase [bacterium]